MEPEHFRRKIFDRFLDINVYYNTYSITHLVLFVTRHTPWRKIFIQPWLQFVLRQYFNIYMKNKIFACITCEAAGRDNSLDGGKGGLGWVVSRVRA